MEPADKDQKDLGVPTPFGSHSLSRELFDTGLEESMTGPAQYRDVNLAEVGPESPVRVTCMLAHTDAASFEHAQESTRIRQLGQPSSSYRMQPATDYSGNRNSSSQYIDPSLLEGSGSWSYDDRHGSIAGAEYGGQPFPVEIDVQEEHVERRTPTSVTKAKRVRTRISAEAKAVLRTHFDINSYPSKKELEVIAGLAKLDVKPAQTWFENERRRDQRKSNGMCIPCRTNQLLLTIDAGNRSNSIGTSNYVVGTGASQDGSKLDSISLSALSEKSASSNHSIDRWRDLPIDEEPVPRATIEQYLDVGSSSPGLLGIPRTHSRGSSIDSPSDRHAFNNNGFGSVTSRAPSSVDTSRSGSSAGNVSRSRRGKKQHPGGINHPRRSSVRSSGSFNAGGSQGSDAPLYPFCCTFGQCGATFKTQYEWKRHEEAVHFEALHWICCKGLDTFTFPEDHCLFCNDRNVDFTHMESHRFSFCVNKSEEERVFARKDQLLDHIRRVHHQNRQTENLQLPKILDLWRRKNENIDPRALHCGFCGQSFRTWDDRAHHVGGHFRKGLDLQAWWPLRRDNEFRHPPTAIRGPHSAVAGPNNPFAVCQCCPELVGHITENHPLWYVTLPPAPQLEFQ
jgi:hypothetical protein